MGDAVKQFRSEGFPLEGAVGFSAVLEGGQCRAVSAQRGAGVENWGVQDRSGIKLIQELQDRCNNCRMSPFRVPVVFQV